MSPTASAGQLKATQRGSHTSRTSTVTQVAQVPSTITPSQKSHKSHKYCDTSTKNCHIVAQVLYCHCSNLLLGNYCNKVEADMLSSALILLKLFDRISFNLFSSAFQFCQNVLSMNFNIWRQLSPLCRFQSEAMFCFVAAVG